MIYYALTDIYFVLYDFTLGENAVLWPAPTVIEANVRHNSI